MSSTIENIHFTIILRINTLLDACETFDPHRDGPINNTVNPTIENTINAIAENEPTEILTSETLDPLIAADEFESIALACQTQDTIPDLRWAPVSDVPDLAADYLAVVRSVAVGIPHSRMVNKPFRFISSSTSRYTACCTTTARDTRATQYTIGRALARGQTICADTRRVLESVRRAYDLRSLEYIMAYKNRPDEATYNAYIKYLIAENILNTLDACHAALLSFYKSVVASEDTEYFEAAAPLRGIARRATQRKLDPQLSDKIDALHVALEAFSAHHAPITYVEPTTQQCACGAFFDVDQRMCEYICHKCGANEKLYGVVFEDEHLYYPDGQRSKHSHQDPIKHCKLWLDRIQAIENKTIEPSIIDQIKKKIWQLNIWADQITCGTIRKILKKVRLTTYNDHVPLIRRLITGRAPPLLTEAERRVVYMDFSLATEIYNSIKPPDKVNCPYNPYFLYRILEMRVDPHDPQRKQEILDCIHLQSHETTVEHSKLWDVIQERMIRKRAAAQ